MEITNVNQLIKTAKKAEELTEKIKYLQDYLADLDSKKLKGILEIKSLRRSPSEYSNDLIWAELRLPSDYIDYDKFEKLCTAEIKHQLEDNLKATQAELEKLING